MGLNLSGRFGMVWSLVDLSGLNLSSRFGMVWSLVDLSGLGMEPG